MSLIALRAANYKDPYIEAEIAEIRRIFQSMPTYNKTKTAISYTDAPALFEAIGHERTPSQVKKIQDFWITNWEGEETEERFINLMSAIYDTREFARQLVLEVDRNKDGFISEADFKYLTIYLAQHDSTYQGGTFETFVIEAGTNKDGRVSVEECIAWLLQRYPESVNVN